ncbi:MAG: type II secretion system protein [Candidatus Thorarchaeota archaeon]
MRWHYNKKGYTLVEILIVIACIAIVALVNIGVIALACGNYWYTEEGVERQLKIDHPNITRVLRTQRNVFSFSVITVEEDGRRVEYCLDTGIFFNYEFHDCS